jgi:hypothetical protein
VKSSTVYFRCARAFDIPLARIAAVVKHTDITVITQIFALWLFDVSTAYRVPAAGVAISARKGGLEESRAEGEVECSVTQLDLTGTGRQPPFLSVRGHPTDWYLVF